MMGVRAWKLAVGVIAFVSAGGYYTLAHLERLPTYNLLSNTLASSSPVSGFQVTHLATPEPVRAIYMTSYVAGINNWRQRIVKLIGGTELNALVIDVKDYTGMLVSERAPDITDFIRQLHQRGIYVIGRVSAFQDQRYVKEHPELAVRRRDNGGVWRDRKGIAWLDAGSQEAWDYIVKVSQNAYALGFDEINLDYIRFPSDGDMRNARYPFEAATSTKVMVMRDFYKYISAKLHEQGIPVSADLFGMVTTNYDDLGIGQFLENALTYFDFVSPMVYPSHFPPTFNGWADPNKVPGPLVAFVMSRALARANALDEAASTTRATATPPTRDKLRPWLQDFQYGGHYGEAEVRAQKNALYANGLTSWMLWDPAVRYTPNALDPVVKRSSTTRFDKAATSS